MPKTKGREFWQRVIDEFEKSGQRQIAFAQKKGITLSSLQNWLYKLRNEGTKNETPLLLPANTPDSNGMMVEIVTTSGTIRFPEGTSVTYVAGLLQAVRDHAKAPRFDRGTRDRFARECEKAPVATAV